MCGRGQGGGGRGGGGSCVLGADQKHLDVPPLHLSGHLAPGARDAEGGAQAVVAHVALQGAHRDVRHSHFPPIILNLRQFHRVKTADRIVESL